MAQNEVVKWFKLFIFLRNLLQNTRTIGREWYDYVMYLLGLPREESVKETQQSHQGKKGSEAPTQMIREYFQRATKAKNSVLLINATNHN